MKYVTVLSIRNLNKVSGGMQQVNNMFGDPITLTPQIKIPLNATSYMQVHERKKLKKSCVAILVK